MKISVGEDNCLVLKEVYNSVIFKSDDNEHLVVCMRDGGFEIAIKDNSVKSKETYYKWFTVKDGEIKEQIPSAKIYPGETCSSLEGGER